MKVAFITHYTALYGANRSLLNLIEGLEQHGVSGYIVSPGEGELVDVARGRDIPVVVFPIQMWMSRPLLSCGLVGRIREHIRWRVDTLQRLLENLRTLPSLSKQLRFWNADIVYTNSATIPIGMFVSAWLRMPHVWHLREFGDLDYGLYPDWGKTIFRRLISSADAVIAISESVRSYVLSGVDANVHTIYNGVAWQADFDARYKLAQAQRSYQRSYIFAMVGYIHPRKGQDVAIQALAIVIERYPDTRLLIVGGGETNFIEQLADELGIKDNVEFWGYVDDPYQAYIAADAVLMCSKNEAMGRVTVEAMSACRPVIGYDNAGTAELIEHERTGLLYQDGPDELAQRMIWFIENPQWACQLGENAWRVAREKYAIEVYSERIYKVLCSVLG